MKDSPQARRHAPFEILKLGVDDEQRIGEAESFGSAMFIVELAAARSPGRYVIRNQNTGERKVLNFEPKSWQRGA